MRDPHLTSFYRALHRPNLLLGGDRELVMFTGLVCGGLAISSQNWPATIIGASVWFINLAICRQMAKVDPHLVKVYLRHVKFNDYYAPLPTRWRKD